jgi:hypothetical protein
MVKVQYAKNTPCGLFPTNSSAYGDSIDNDSRTLPDSDNDVGIFDRESCWDDDEPFIQDACFGVVSLVSGSTQTSLILLGRCGRYLE